jgi:molybdenum cofactor cytidylyltransferase
MVVKPSGVSALLLAAGESRRMGAFKQLLRIGDKTFVEHCVDALLSSRVDEIVVVTGHRAAEVEKALVGRAVRFAHNDRFSSGMSSSIIRGVGEISPQTGACLIALADQPLIPTRVIDELITTYETDRALVVIPAFQGRGGHPVLVDLSLREELKAIDPTRGLREVITRHSGQTVRVEVETETVLQDFDYPRDYEGIAKIG